MKLMNLQNMSKSVFTGLAFFAILVIGMGTNACSTNVEENKNTPKDTNSAGVETVTTTPKSESSETPETKPTEEEKNEKKKEEPKTEEKNEKKKEVKKVDDGISKLKKEMPYADARKTLIAAGWKPVKNNEVGEFGNEKRMVDEFKYIEVDACSGTGVGYCSFSFKHSDGRSLSVTTVNNEEGQKGGPIVSGWSVD